MWSSIYMLQLFFLVTNAGDCHPPPLAGGHVTGQSSGNSWVGTFSCRGGSSLVGEARLKCRAGVWSSQFPVCTAIGKCDPSLLPGIENGKKQAVKKFRRSVFRFVCNRGFDLVGEDLVYCEEGRWSLERAPLCTRLGCDEGLVANIEHGVSKRLHSGTVYQFACSDGTVLAGSYTLVCDGTRWNDTTPVCLTGPASITMSGPSTMSMERKEMYSCITSPSKKPGKVQWKVTDSLGKDVPNVIEKTNSTITWTDSGSITTSSAIMSTSSPLHLLIVMCTTTGEYSVGDTMQVLVQYPPKNISVDAPHTVNSGDSFTAICTSSPSMPASSIHWVVEQGDNTERKEPEPVVSQVSAGGFVTTSSVTVTAGSGDQILLECYADNVEMGDESLAYAHVVTVISPPGLPTIQGLDLDTPVILGSHVSLHCSAKSGNPPAKLVWYRGRQVMESHSELLSDTVTAYVTFVADDGPDQELTCEASNDAVKGSLKKTINIQVIPPKTTTTTTTTTQPTTTSSTRPSLQSTPRAKLVSVAAKRTQELYDRPVADMPAEEEAMYDYSHFSYLNDQFEETYKETLAYAQEYYAEEYEYIENIEEENEDDTSKDTVVYKSENDKDNENFIFGANSSRKHSCTVWLAVLVLVKVWVWHNWTRDISLV